MTGEGEGSADELGDCFGSLKPRPRNDEEGEKGDGKEGTERRNLEMFRQAQHDMQG